MVAYPTLLKFFAFVVIVQFVAMLVIKSSGSDFMGVMKNMNLSDEQKKILKKSSKVRKNVFMTGCTIGVILFVLVFYPDRWMELLGFIGFVYVFAGVYYMASTRNIGTPFRDSLTDNQKSMKKNKSNNSYMIGTAIGILVALFLWNKV